jgi:hypothetical protein
VGQVQVQGRSKLPALCDASPPRTHHIYTYQQGMASLIQAVDVGKMQAGMSASLAAGIDPTAVIRAFQASPSLAKAMENPRVMAALMDMARCVVGVWRRHRWCWLGWGLCEVLRRQSARRGDSSHSLSQLTLLPSLSVPARAPTHAHHTTATVRMLSKSTKGTRTLLKQQWRRARYCNSCSR